MNSVDLIARLVAATGPDREIDARIQCELQGFKFIAFDDSRAGEQITYEGPHNALDGVRHYTESVDAALTLIEDYFYILGCGRTRTNEPLYAAQALPAEIGNKTVLGEAESDVNQAIPICIAALKARSA